LPFQGPPNFTKIGIFGLKTSHLATLVVVVANAIVQWSMLLPQFSAIFDNFRRNKLRFLLKNNVMTKF
jgi:hypothetical protein